MDNIRSIFAKKVVFKSLLTKYDYRIKDIDTEQLLQKSIIKNNIIKFIKYKNKTKDIKNIINTMFVFNNKLSSKSYSYCEYIFEDKNFNNVIIIFEDFIKFHNNNCKDDEKLRLIKNYNINLREIFEGHDIKIYEIYIKKKNDLDILTFEECLIENQNNLINLKIFKDEMQYYKTYFKNFNYENVNIYSETSNNFKKSRIYEGFNILELSPELELKDVFEDFSSSLIYDGFIKNEHISYNTNNLKINKCKILEQWLTCYKKQDKKGISQNWKYIENMFINKKICTILIEDTD
jgi:hypothetical protein